METFTLVITSTINFLLFYYCTNIFLNNKFFLCREDFGGYILTLLASFASLNFSLTSIILVQLALILYIDARFELSFFKTLILFILTYSIIMVEKFMLDFIFLFFVFPIQSAFFSIFHYIVLLFVTVFLFRTNVIRNLYKQFIHSGLFIQILLINCYIIISTFLFFYTENHSKFYDNIIYILCCVFFLLISNFYLLYYDHKLNSKQQELLSYQKNLPIYKSLIDEIRTNQHEFANRLQHLQYLPYTCKDYNSLCDALTKNTQAYMSAQQAYPLLRIQMPLLAAALYNLYCQGIKKNLNFSLDIASGILHSKIPEYKLSDFISILMQNAIDACSSNDTIYIRLESLSETIRFEVRNPVDHLFSYAELNHFFDQGFTTKKEIQTSHGFGLYLLQQEIKKANGSILTDCYYFENQFWLSISIEV